MSRDHDCPSSEPINVSANIHSVFSGGITHVILSATLLKRLIQRTTGVAGTPTRTPLRAGKLFLDVDNGTPIEWQAVVGRHRAESDTIAVDVALWLLSELTGQENADHIRRLMGF